MASLQDGRIIVTNADGVRESGGKLRIYDIGTTDLTPVFTTEAMGTPLTNPVVADAAGVLPQIFGVDGTVSDCTMLDADDVEISGRSFQMAFTGDTTGVIIRDFGDARFQVYEDASTLHLEAGDQEGDDVGGSLRIGGWDGTPADAIELDGPVNVTDELTEKGKKLSATVYTEGTVFTSVASVDIPLPEASPGIRAWRVTVIKMLQEGSGGNIEGRLSYEADPASFKSGASDYAWGINYNSNLTPTSAADNADTLMRLCVMGGSTTLWGKMVLEIDTPDSGNGPTTIVGTAAMFNGNSPPQMEAYSIAAAGLGNYGRAAVLRLIGTQDISGVYLVEPLRGFGE